MKKAPAKIVVQRYLLDYIASCCGCTADDVHIEWFGYERGSLRIAEIAVPFDTFTRWDCLGDDTGPARLFLIAEQWCVAMLNEDSDEVVEMESLLRSFFKKEQTPPEPKDTQRPVRIALKRAIDMVLDNEMDRRIGAVCDKDSANMRTVLGLWRWAHPFTASDTKYLVEMLLKARERRDKNHPFWRVGGQGHTAIRRAQKWLKENSG